MEESLGNLFRDIRKILAVLIVGGWVVSAFLILLTIVTGLISFNEGVEILKTFSSVSSGFVGMILGYYFTRDNQGG
jgi:hypothetical protein